MFSKPNILNDEEENENGDGKSSSWEDLRESEFEENLDEYGDGDEELILPGEDEATDEEEI